MISAYRGYVNDLPASAVMYAYRGYGNDLPTSTVMYAYPVGIYVYPRVW